MSEMMYPNLFSPVTIRGKTFRNRILVAPLGAEIPDEGSDGKMSDQAITFYRRVARGGCARVMSGENDVIFGGAVHGMYPFCEAEPTEAFRDSFRRYAEACHEEGALAFTSFGHMGVFGRTFPGGVFEMDALMGGGPPPAGMPGGPAPEGMPPAPGGPGPAGMPPMPGGLGPAGMPPMPGGPGMPPKADNPLPGTMPPMAPPYIPKGKDGKPYKFPEKAYGPSDMIVEEPYDGYSQPGMLGFNGHDGTRVYGVTLEQMNEFADAFAHCARVAKECGLDGINIHSGHGFMFAPWISERFNKRTDEFGGSFENRCRFPIMVLQRIREAVGDDFIIELRWSGEENAKPIYDKEAFEHMLTIEDTVRFFRELDRHPGLVDIAHISAGLHHNALYNSRTISNFYFPEGLNVEDAAKVKAAVKNIKVGVVGGMTDPALCEKAIADGKVDFVIMARQLLIADPAFAGKAEAGHPEDINNCLRCASCRAHGHCTVNPVNLMTASDGECDPGPQVSGRTLVVVGGGIGGMKAAEYAALRGFRVVLFEKEKELGGILRYTDHDRFKTTLRRYKDNVEKRLYKLGVDVRLGQAASPEDVAAEKPDAVIVATGGTPVPAAFPCGEGANVIDVTAAYLAPERVGQKVVVVGAGQSGCEAAIHWGDMGKEVTLLSRSPKILKGFAGSSPFASVETYLVMLDNSRVELHKGCACVSATKEGVRAVSSEGECFFPADTVILASGIRPVPGAEAPFAGTAPVVTAIGDSVHPALVGDATYAAWQAVRGL